MAERPHRKVLNVGGASKEIPLPPQYQGWEHVLLDIDPRGNPDVVCDARDLGTTEPGVYDAVYCSHNLEHYFRHHARKVLQAFAHVIKPEGFVEIRVPDLESLIRTVAANGLDLTDVLYQSPAGPIMVLDVLYGYSVEIERSGQDFFAHKTGFTPRSLVRMLQEVGFVSLFLGSAPFEIRAWAFLAPPIDEYRTLLRLQP